MRRRKEGPPLPPSSLDYRLRSLPGPVHGGGPARSLQGRRRGRRHAVRSIAVAAAAVRRQALLRLVADGDDGADGAPGEPAAGERLVLHVYTTAPTRSPSEGG